ncbi:hypothetical protein K2224_34665 (plasmid) [Streptomyces sp. BHT-5-2]|uniref:hypothetical protein n=1 Tax=Streptomyces sp. BHT-5-2 TaxID=2866715 RepID=UPI001C8E71CD|nr:hypothetical protein [Streptomyces sp. BHT-5-2]QZL09448.1 hypothetical protein K2224_34665 [Streptomyces sp. BHT-5-2]
MPLRRTRALAAAPPATSYLAAGRAGAMHGDTASSDTTPRRVTGVVRIAPR